LLLIVSLLTDQLEGIYAIYSDSFYRLAKQSWSFLGPTTRRRGTDT